MLFIEIIFIVFMFWMIFWQGSMLLAAIIGSPIVYSSHSAVRDCLRLAKLKEGETVLDLGCGNGRTLIIAAKEFGAKGVGIDRSLYCVLKARLNVYLAGQSENIKIFRKSFGNASAEIKDADVVYLYLLNSALKKIEPWFFSVISPKQRVVSLAFEFSVHQPVAEAKTVNLGRKTTIRQYLK